MLYAIAAFAVLVTLNNPVDSPPSSYIIGDNTVTCERVEIAPSTWTKADPTCQDVIAADED